LRFRKVAGGLGLNYSGLIGQVPSRSSLKTALSALRGELADNPTLREVQSQLSDSRFCVWVDWICKHRAVINQLRAFLLERGLVFAKTPANLRAALPSVLENADLDLTPQMRNLIDLLWNEWKIIEGQIEGLSLELKRISAADPGCTRIRQIPGIGPIVAAIGNGAAFRKGRDFAAWLGVVPRQYSTGGKARLLGISKRGNVYLRKILIHGARAAVLRTKRDRAPIGAWLDALDARAPKNVVVVAMANKLARIAWAVLSSGEPYRPNRNMVTA
jgi:transposase